MSEARWHDLGRMIAQGDYWAGKAVRSHLGDHAGLDRGARRIKRHGLTPDGAVPS
ncbi:hypothetical protein ABZ816_15515 [Actinosynnema sp. NPDC047251]|uniref:hypothetical protein n=1 Tax=Saccharothrix espanaensis TaxID=103731 RepID=UPI0002E3E683|nr:hypothetical protein [Saccharothrix espanaensis]